jgi:CIC family chloride channel protein
VPPYHLEHPAELAAYAALGIVGGVLSVVFCKLLLGLRLLFRRLPSSTAILQPAIGGLMIGALLVAAPEVMGVGYEYVDQALNGGLLFRTLLFLCVMKLVATVVSYSSGNAGGIFAPTLYIGAMLGGALGTIVHRTAPFPTGDPGAYALVGMGALFAGIIRAPMTSVFMIFEITQDYQILVPLMVANMLSFAISKRYQPAPVYHALLQQDGIHLPSVALHPQAVSKTARDVMVTDFPLVAPDMPLGELAQFAAAHPAPAYLVGTTDRLMGTATRDDIERWHAKGDGAARVASLVNDTFVHTHPDHPIDVVLDRLWSSGGVLPVVSRTEAHRLVGVVTAQSLLTADRPNRAANAR